MVAVLAVVDLVEATAVGAMVVAVLVADLEAAPMEVVFVVDGVAVAGEEVGDGAMRHTCMMAIIPTTAIMDIPIHPMLMAAMAHTGIWAIAISGAVQSTARRIVTVSSDTNE